MAANPQPSCPFWPDAGLAIRMGSEWQPVRQTAVDIGDVTLSSDRWQDGTLEFPCPPLGAAELTASEAERMAGMFKALADPVRLRLFSRVAAHQSGEASVCDIQNVGVSQPTVSHHLK